MGEENLNEFLWGQVSYVNKETGEIKPFTGLGTAKFEDIKEPLCDEFEEYKDKIVMTIPRNEEFTIEFTQTSKQARKTHKFVNALINSHKRRIRSWYRTKERLRRARLKGKEYIRVSPRIIAYLRSIGVNQNES